MESLSGIIERVTFFSEQSGWSVLKVTPFQSSGEVVTVTVHQAKVFPGATVEFQGDWVEHGQYGTQFKAVSFFEKKPASIAALEKYLGSGLIYGVGPVTAKKIVAQFKEQTLDIFENEMDRLMEIRGIAQGKLEVIRKSWEEHRNIRNVMLFLQNHGLSTLFAVKIYKRYGDESIEIVQDNPYRLALDIYGIGFLSADRIAKAMGIEGRDPRRLRAAIQHVLAASREEGHCYLFFHQVICSLEDLLELSSLEGDARQCLEEMEENGEIKTRTIEGSPCYYSKTLFFHEKYVAEKVSLLKRKPSALDGERVGRWIEKFNTQQVHPLSQEQGESVKGVVGEGFSILTGGPGCGKTTTTKAIVRLLLAMGKRVLLAAPTGRASQRMEEVIGLPAQTIHRLLIWNPAQGGFKKGEQDPLDTDFLIIDECSMLDISLTASLLKAVNPKGTQVLFIGDHDQLPSVGAGNVLKDLIASEAVAVFFLTQVFRQAKESLIIKYAHEINRGQVPRIDTPFRDHSLWEKGCDVLFIDAEEATARGVQFIKRVKRVLNDQVSREGEGILLQKMGAQRVSQGEEGFLVENISEQEWERIKEGKLKHDVISISDKFEHVNIEKLLESKTESEEVREIIKSIHPFSSLHYGVTGSEMVMKLHQEIIPKYRGEGVEVQILSPMTRGSMGTFALNKKIQDRLRGLFPERKQLSVGQKIFLEGDRVIQKKNNYDLEVFNGDIGKIISMDLGTPQIVVCFPRGREVLYKRENLLELDLAYAITIHKSQGSEFDTVIIPVVTQHFKLLLRNLIYTGLTRGKKLVVFVGTRKALAIAVKNDHNKKRQTFLKELTALIH